MAENNQNQDKIVYLGETNFRNQRIKFGIKKDDRRRHCYLIGKTGMGKSTTMENMIIQDIINGEGLCLVDPHGDLAENILNFIPSSRINDVIYLNPADVEHPIAFNVMESVRHEHQHLVASGMIGVFKKLWADSWGPRLEYLLRNAILALLDYPGSTLLGVMRLLSDKTYRNKVITKIQDPVVKAFWVNEFSRYPQQFQVEAIAPIQNKVGQFLSTALIRNVVGQVKSSFDLRDVMDQQKILIMNLSKGRVGEDASALLGAMMITKVQLAAMSRIEIEEKERKDFYLYVDEFQNFATESFANILSEARKYRLNLVIGHQYIEQLNEVVKPAVFGNVGTIMCFRIGAADAEFLATEFAPYFTEEDLVNLAKHNVYLKLMIDGVSSNPFSATTLPPLGDQVFTNNKDKIIKVSRERYATPRKTVEDKIGRWSGVIDEPAEQGAQNSNYRRSDKTDAPERPRQDRQAKRETRSFDNSKNSNEQKPKENDRRKNPKDNKQTFDVNCYECGKKTEITFKPDGVRPIYCTDCFKDIRQKLLKDEEISGQKPIEEISLAEALKKKPQAFDKGKKIESKPEKRELPREVKADTKILNLKQENTKTKGAEVNIPTQQPIATSGQSLGQSKNSPKSLAAGKVIKF